jgi:hypothetical protein
VNLDLVLYREIEKAINELQEKVAAELIQNKAVSFDDYKYRVGRIRGLHDAMKAAKEAQERILGVEKRES